MSTSSDETVFFCIDSLLHPSRRRFVRGLGAALALPLVTRAWGDGARSTATYKNPLDVTIGDPYVLKAPDGRYYIYGSGGGGAPFEDGSDRASGFPAFTSRNLVDWTSLGRTYIHDPATSWGVGAFWAPEVFFVKGRYYMFFSAQWRHNPTNEVENFRIGVASAETPAGPFRDVRNEPLFDPGFPAIDADVLFDDDGRVYLYFSRCCYKHPVESELAEKMKNAGVYSEIEESWVYGVELKPDLSGVIGESMVLIRPPVTLADPNSAWEDVSVETHEVNRRWTEGPCSFKRYGKYFIMYSANTVAGENYMLGYATAEHPLGPFTKAANNPVARKNTDHGGDVSCTAHNCVTMSPDGSEMFCLYGARTKETGERRVLFLNRMEVQKGGTLEVYPPDTTIVHAMPSGSMTG
jgi:GH43 family beta-xylosidase